jgi:hypothetical protein
MWVLTEDDNEAAVATYHRAGGAAPSGHVMIEWLFGDPSGDAANAVTAGVQRENRTKDRS